MVRAYFTRNILPSWWRLRGVVATRLRRVKKGSGNRGIYYFVVPHHRLNYLTFPTNKYSRHSNRTGENSKQMYRQGFDKRTSVKHPGHLLLSNFRKTARHRHLSSERRAVKRANAAREFWFSCRMLVQMPHRGSIRTRTTARQSGRLLLFVARTLSCPNLYSINSPLSRTSDRQKLLSAGESDRSRRKNKFHGSGWRASAESRILEIRYFHRATWKVNTPFRKVAALPEESRRGNTQSGTVFVACRTGTSPETR